MVATLKTNCDECGAPVPDDAALMLVGVLVERRALASDHRPPRGDRFSQGPLAREVCSPGCGLAFFRKAWEMAALIGTGAAEPAALTDQQAAQ